MKQRVRWADILKMLGMLLIYLGHLPVSENTYLFIFAQHVPLFFFAAGFFATMEPKEGSFFAFLWKKIRSLVIPYFLFSLLTILYMCIAGMRSWDALPQMLLSMALGIRNQTPAIQLWFLPCLFVISIFFELAKRIIRSKWFLALIVAALYVVGIFFLGHQPTLYPSWAWNVDSAFVYLLYFFLGALLFPIVHAWHYKKQKSGIKALWWILFLLSLAYEVLLLFRSTAISAYLNQALGGRWFQLVNLCSTLLLLFFFVSLARLLEKIPGVSTFLARIGKDSLYLNGNEMIFKNLFSLLFGVLGWTHMIYSNDALMALFSFLLMILLTFTIDLLERAVFGKLFGDR